MILVVGLCAALAGGLLVEATRAPVFGRVGGWGEAWDYGPGTVTGLVARLGAPLCARGAPAGVREAVRLLAGFLLCREQAAAGVLVLAALVAGSATVFGWKVGGLFVAAWLIRARGRDRDEAASNRRSWEVEMCRTLQRVRLQVAAGRPLRVAVEESRSEARGVASPILAELASRWSAGDDAGGAFAAVARHAPDAATAAFFSRVSTAARSGDPMLPILDAEVDRLRAARRQRLDGELQRLPTQLVLFRGLMMLASVGPVVAFVLVMLEGVKTIF